MPLTAAEKQKRYRERMRANNPEKFEQAKLKNKMRNKERKKISECTEKEKENQRKQWRNSKQRQKSKLKEICEENKMAPKSAAERQKQYREKLKNENPQKLEAMKKKNAERALVYYRSKIKKIREERKKIKEERKENETESQGKEKVENWYREDKIILKNLVRERVKILENKNTDTQSNAEKFTGWLDLQESFNSMCKGVPRTVPQLKRKWNILKALEKNKLCAPTNGFINTGSDTAPMELSSSDDISTDSSNILDSDPLDQNTTTEQHITSEQNLPSLRVIPAYRMRKMIRKSPTPAEKLAAYELECRRELHAIQMENERQIQNNLTLKECLLLEKIKFYKSKNN